MKKIIFIADYFYKDITGGAELNDYSLIHRLESEGYSVKKINCEDININFLSENINGKFIIANFIKLTKDCIEYISNNLNYVIYEHDHKYLKSRNPINYPNFIAPPEEITNLSFYKNARSVICLTELAVEVIKSNTSLENISKIGSSIWTDEDLDFIKSIITNDKKNKFAVMDSDNPIKKKNKCIKYCIANNLKYELIRDRDNRKFLHKLSKYAGLVFMTGHLETCCRIVVEAKMMNCRVITQKKLIGAASEDWFSLNGEELIEKIRSISKNSVDIFIKALKDYK